MGIYSIVIAIMFLVFIPLFELIRKKDRKIDFLTAINLFFLLLYGIVPLYLYMFNQHLTWKVLMRTDMEDTVFLLGALLALLFYLTFVVTYYFTKKLKVTQKIKSNSKMMFGEIQQRQFFKVAMILFITGMVSLLIYIRELGGYSEYMRLGELIRNDGSVYYTPLAFLKHFTPFLYLSTFLFYSFIGKSRGVNKFLMFLFFVASAIGAAIVAIQGSGRLTLLVFVITIPLAHMFKSNKIKLRTITLVGTLFFILAIYGDELLSKNDLVVYEQPKTLLEVSTGVVEEFSFPFNNIGNALTIFPRQEDFRYGIPDIINAFLQYIPSSVLNLDFNRGTVSQLNTTFYDNYGQIPVDAVTFGYMSFGIAGVLLYAVLLGFVTQILESVFHYRGDLISRIFYVSMMFQTMFAIMYGDPHQIIMGFFRYFVAFALIYVFVRRSIKGVKRYRVVWSK